MAKAPSPTAKPDAKRAEDQRLRDNLAALGFDPSMAEWVLTWEVDAEGRIVEGSTGLIKPENDNA